jgi:hypothetical protein
VQAPTNERNRIASNNDENHTNVLSLIMALSP